MALAHATKLALDLPLTVTRLLAVTHLHRHRQGLLVLTYLAASPFSSLQLQVWFVVDTRVPRDYNILQQILWDVRMYCPAALTGKECAAKHKIGSSHRLF